MKILKEDKHLPGEPGELNIPSPITAKQSEPQLVSSQRYIQPSNLHSFYSLPAVNYDVPPSLLINPLFYSMFDVNSGYRGIGENPRKSMDQVSQYYQSIFASQSDDYYKYYPQSYYYMLGNDYMQIVRPNIININNVNANGNALIINNQPIDKSVNLREDQKIQQKDNAEAIFKIDVDKEYYNKRYACHNLLSN